MRLGLDNKFSAGEYSRKILSKIPISKMCLKNGRIKTDEGKRYVEINHSHGIFKAAIQK